MCRFLVQAVAGSVLPEDDRRPSPALPALQTALASVAGAAAAGAAPQDQQQSRPAAAAAVQPAATVPEGGVQLPPAFFSLLGAAPQQQQQLPAAAMQAAAAAVGQQQTVAAGLPPIGQVTPGPAGSITGSLQAQPQQAAGLRALLFGAGGGRQPVPAPYIAPQAQQQAQMQAQQQPQTLHPLQQQQLAPLPASAAGQPALLSSATPADRWAWMGAFGGSTATAAPPAAPTAAPSAPARQQAAGLPLPIPLGQHPAGWQQGQQPQ